MYALRIRGIYATTLTSLLREDFKIVQPSEPICERFDLEPDQEPYDLDIYDLEDRQGIFISGEREGLEQLISILQQELLDVIVRRFELGLYAVYRGVVQSNGPEGTLIDLGNALGFLPKEEFHPGEAVTVQVYALPGRGREPLLRRMIGIPGRYAVLISTGRIAVSRKIADHGERLRLSWLGAELAPQGWGIVWHTAAAGRSRAALAEDIERLAQQAAELAEQAKALEPPARLLAGEAAAQLEFPGGSKERLDELRNEVVSTILGHHRYRAHIESTAELQEEQSIFPEVGDELLIEHVKPDGQTLQLGRGWVIEAEPEGQALKLEREIKAPGEYDGLKVIKEPGDRAITEFIEGSWYYRTSYYSPAGELKGEYCNINTPIEIYPDRVRYIDLEIDVVRLPDSEPQVIDEQKLERTVERGWITEKLAQRAREVVRAILEDSEPGVAEGP